MLNLFENVIRQTVDRISNHIATYAPGLLAGLLIVLVSYILARIARWLLSRIFKGISFDRFLRQSGLSSMMNRSGKVHAAELVANTVFWLIFIGGLLTAISALDTQITSRITETVVFLSPKLLAAAAILVAGIWMGRYLSRHILVWAVNEGIPSGRRLAAAVRVLVVFVSVAAAADYLDFARNVFLAALIIVIGGIVLSASLAVGLCGKEMLLRYFQGKPDHEKEKEKDDMSLWRHL